MAGTYLVYNGIVLENVLTREFSQTPVRDLTNTDQWYQRFLVRVEAIVNADLLALTSPSIGLIPPNKQGLSTAAQIELIARRYLSEDRKDLAYVMQGTTLLKSTANDADNGPKVQHLNITHISPATLRIEFAVECCIIECEKKNPDGSTVTSGSPSPVVNNRWSCADDLDDTFTTRRVWRGRLRLASAAKAPHDFRGLVVPALDRGFRRARMSFTSEANALELGYEIVDQEMLGEAAPSPAVRMEASHVETVSRELPNGIGECVVKLTGHKGSDKREMIQRAAQIVNAKLQILNKANTLSVLSYVIADYFGDAANSVEVRSQVMHSSGTRRSAEADVGAVVMEKMGTSLKNDLPEYDNAVAVVLGPFGSANLASLFACYLQSPCNPNHAMPKQISQPPTKSDGGERNPNENGTEIIYKEGPVTSAFDPPPYSSDHQDAIYTFYQIDTIIEKTHGRVQLPIAYLPPGSNATSVVIDVHSPTAKRRVKLTGERHGDWPKIFADVDWVDPSGIAHSILEFRPNFRSPKPNANGRQFAVDAEYVWAMSRAPNSVESVRIPSLPWDNLTGAAFPSSAYQNP